MTGLPLVLSILLTVVAPLILVSDNLWNKRKNQTPRSLWYLPAFIIFGIGMFGLVQNYEYYGIQKQERIIDEITSESTKTWKSCVPERQIILNKRDRF